MISINVLKMIRYLKGNIAVTRTNDWYSFCARSYLVSLSFLKETIKDFVFRIFFVIVRIFLDVRRNRNTIETKTVEGTKELVRRGFNEVNGR